jgi:hypothetical protein
VLRDLGGHRRPGAATTFDRRILSSPAGALADSIHNRVGVVTKVTM